MRSLQLRAHPFSSPMQLNIVPPDSSNLKIYIPPQNMSQTTFMTSTMCPYISIWFLNLQKIMVENFQFSAIFLQDLI